MGATMRIQIQRVHDVLDDEGSASGEFRVLVDRLWPRGIARERLRYDDWDKDVTPSADLRTAFHDGSMDFEEFSRHYREELDASDAPQELLDRARRARASRITLLFAAKDVEHTHAKVLQDVLETARDAD